MTAKSPHKASLSSAIKIIGGLLLFLCLSNAAFAQNTKGDKPVKNQRQVREGKTKSVRKGGKASTKDIAGRRLRTRNKSSANRANASYPQPKPYANRSKRSTDRAAAPRGRVFNTSPRESRTRAWQGNISGHPIRRVTPSKSGVARNNVYPQSGPYVKGSPKPRKSDSRKFIGRTAKGNRVVNRKPSNKQKAWKGDLKGGPVGTHPSATGSVPNVYPQRNPYSRYSGKEVRRKEKSISNNGIAGRNFRLRSAPGPNGRNSGYPSSASGLFLRKGKRNPYWGKYSKGERPFTRDIAGGPLLKRNFRSSPMGFVKQDTLKFFGRKPHGDRAYKGPRSGGISATPSTQRGWKGDLAGRRLRSPRGKIQTNETAGGFVFPRKLSISAKMKRGGRYSPGGGGSISGRGRNNSALPPRAPGIGASGISKGLARTKGQRPLKGGGSISGGGWNNKGHAIDPRSPGQGSIRAGRFAGNMKGGRPLKGGGSVSGRLWNNNGKAIDPRSPGQSSIRAGRFAGNVKGSRPLKGGGSISGKLWNNIQTPIEPRSPGQSSIRAGRFAGNIKGSKPLKGGGSVSGKLWNNNESPIDPRSPGQSSIKAGRFAGNMKAKRPQKGGGSVSGKLWNNDEKPIEVRTPLGEDANAVAGFGKMKMRRKYIQNEKAHDLSILKQKPNENAYLANGLQIKVKRGKYEKKPEAVEDALLGIGPKSSTVKASKYGGNVKMARNYKHNPNSAKDALDGVPPTKSSVKASEYSRSMKMYWSYKHNPSSSEDALKVRAPKKDWERATTFAGRTRLKQSYRHNPSSADDALKVRDPGKAFAKVTSYQGNVKMNKYNDKRLHPDAQFAHTHRNNVKGERTILMDVKLLWAKLFKKSDTQPENLKVAPPKSKYDKGEKGMWAGDKSYQGNNGNKKEKD